MIDQFNRILRAFGANRVKLVMVCHNQIRFKINGWAAFLINHNGTIFERREEYHSCIYYEDTTRSRWLHAISLGKKRDEEGRIA